MCEGSKPIALPATGIIVTGSSGQQEFSPAIELVFQVGSSVRNLSISYMGFQPHGSPMASIKSTETFFNFRVWSVTFQFNAVSVVSFGSLSGICKHHLHMGIAQFYIIEDGIFL